MIPWMSGGAGRSACGFLGFPRPRSRRLFCHSLLTHFSLGWLVADLGLYKEVVVQMNRDKYAGLYL